MKRRMSGFRQSMITASFLLTLVGGAYAASDWLEGSTDEKLKTLASIQPGLGTVMMEYANRYSDIYYAAKAGNWPLAAYQLKEALEIQEVGEKTRPARAAALKAFEQSFLDPLEKAIEAKNFESFETAFKAGTQGCNGCHAAVGFPFIKYELPSSPPSPLAWSAHH
jgi:hypothetical protein